DSTTWAMAGFRLRLHWSQGMSSRIRQRRFFSALSKKSRKIRQKARSSSSLFDEVGSAMDASAPLQRWTVFFQPADDTSSRRSIWLDYENFPRLSISSSPFRTQSAV